MKKLLALTFSMGLGLMSFGQTPCIDGFADGYPCDGVSLMSHMSIDDLGGAPGLNDIWGWTDFEFCKEYALVGKENGTAFVDITDPLNPCYLGSLPTHTIESTWRDIKTYNNYAFIVSEAGGHGMQVFDLTRLRDVADVPAVFTADAHYDGFGNSHNIAINPETGYAYPIGTSQLSGGPHFINIQDPLNPVTEGGYDASGYSHDAQIITYFGPDEEHQGKEIYFGQNGGNGIVMVDVTDKSDPELISAIGYDSLVYTHQGWFSGDQQFIFVNDEIDEGTFGYNTRTRVFDATDLDNLVEMSFYDSGVSSSDHNHYTKGDFLFQSNYTSGLRILDISNVANDNISTAAFFDVHPEDDFNGYSGSWSNYPYFTSGNVVVTHRQTGLFVVRPEDAAIREATDAIHTEGCIGTVGEGDSQITLCSVSDGINENAGIVFDIYPNPSQGQLNLVTKEEITIVEIIDLTGKVVITENLAQGSSQLTMDISSLANGLYTVRINGLNNSQQQVTVIK